MRYKKYLLFTGIVGLFFLAALCGITMYCKSTARSYIYTEANVPTAQTVLILGARVYSDGRLSDMARDRADTALELYQAHKVSKILISGDHGTKTYDEVNTIRKYIQEHGVVASDIFLDHAGFDTYSSLYRSSAVFEVTSLIIPTQDFHLPRALYLARGLGITAYGVSADKHTYPRVAYNYFREIFSSGKAFLSITFHPNPKFLGPKIPITGDSLQSWDER